jgi:hypothetical protein
MILPMTSWYNSYVLATDIINLWYWGRLISFFLWYLSIYHGTWAMVRLGLGAPLASRSTSSSSNFQVEHTNLEQVGCPAHIQSCNPSWLLTVAAFRPGTRPLRLRVTHCREPGPPDRLGVTDRRSLVPTGIAVSEGSSVQSITRRERVHVTARALIIETQLIRRHCK